MAGRAFSPYSPAPHPGRLLQSSRCEGSVGARCPRLAAAGAWMRPAAAQALRLWARCPRPVSCQAGEDEPGSGRLYCGNSTVAGAPLRPFLWLPCAVGWAAASLLPGKEHPGSWRPGCSPRRNGETSKCGCGFRPVASSLKTGSLPVGFVGPLRGRWLIGKPVINGEPCDLLQKRWGGNGCR